LTFTLAALAAWSSAQAATCTDTVDPRSPVLSNGFGLNAANTRNLPSQIHAGNVATLQTAHAHVADGATDKKGTPAVTAQAIFFAEGRDLVAANRATGCVYWRYSGVSRTLLGVMPNHMRSSAIAYLPPVGEQPALVFAGDFFGNLYAVDAVSGKQLWRAFVGTDSSRHMVTGAPLVHNGTLYVPVASKEVVTAVFSVLGGCCSSHGLLQALDPYTGKVKWTYHTAQAEGSGKLPSGMSLWGAPLIDEANQTIVFGTGQNFAPPTSKREDAIIALDLATGQERWVFQSTQNDAWTFSCVAPRGLDGGCKFTPGGDFDFGAPPMLVKLMSGEQAILAGGKNGVVYSLNPKTGAVNWQTKLGVGGALGGIHWGMAADQHRVYAAVADLTIQKFQKLNSLNFQAMLGSNTVPSVGATPGLYALDLLTGKLLWERHDQHVYQGKTYDTIYSAALTVTNDVLLAGALSGELRALRASTGEALWTFQSAVATQDVNDGKAGHGGTIDSVGAVPVGADLYLNSGYSSFGGPTAWHAGPGNSLFVLRLPGADAP
jgi:polyvinyl alcohol dehydrogenase (cytochrome)